MKILIMGLSGAGKTTLAEKLHSTLDNCAWFNADTVRKMAGDWDFSAEGRIRQAQRMRCYADFESGNGRVAICDFIAPTQSARDSFAADITIWMDTIQSCQYEDTNQIFEKPTNATLRITDWEYELNEIVRMINEF